jgi:outer membrane receptor protein involved in Fe transport
MALTVLTFPLCAQESGDLRGNIADSTGAAVRGAQIVYRSIAGVATTSSDEKGEFALPGVPLDGTLRVNFPGFSTASLKVPAAGPLQTLKIILAPAPNLQRIEVQGGTQDRIPAVPTSQYEIPASEISVSGSLVIDDIFRQVPGFSTFRRSSSLFANPTSQGVSLRGVGASATSRAAVLLDGVPLNDPFGNWVYFQRVPEAEIQSLEVWNGGASDLYGNGALGGVVNIQTRSAEEAYAVGELSYGNLNTPYVSFAAGAPIGGWTIAAAGQALRTEGYILVPPDQRGSVDTNAGTADLTGTFDISHSLGEQGRIFARASGFGESRNNGTVLQKNNTTIPELDLGADWTSKQLGTFSARLYGSTEIYHQTFSAVAANRNSEFLTGSQRNPSQQVGFVGTWSRLFAEKHNVSAGFETRDVRGHSQDTSFVGGMATVLTDSGGRQHTFGIFGQDTFLVAPNWLITFGGRVDTWNNNTGFQNRTVLATGVVTPTTFPDRTETAFSPRASLLHNFQHGLALNASIYRAFRAPTLNELYRNFRVGNIFTLANPALTGEHLTGGEIGLSQQTWNNKLTLRGNFFWSDIGDPVANVTLTKTSSLITRQKENLGVTRGRGFELSGQVQVLPRLQLSAAYLFVNSTVVSYDALPPNMSLAGLRLPQAPQNQFSFQASYFGHKWSAGLQGRFLGDEFDDDQNLLPLGRAFSLDAQITRQILPHTSIFFAAQNLTDNRFAIAKSPVTTEGPPIFIRGGVRFSLR